MVLGITLFLIFGLAVLASNVQPVNAGETIYIKADGSIDPSGAPISTSDNITYTLTDNIYESLIIQRNNTIIDGAGHALHKTESGYGIYLAKSKNVTIKNMEIIGSEYSGGIYHYLSFNNTIIGNNIRDNGEHGIYQAMANSSTICENTITNSTWGLDFDASYGNVAFGNTITDNEYGIRFISSSDNMIFENTIVNNDYGFYRWYTCLNNTVYHNNCIYNTIQAYGFGSGSPNVWDENYPSGGNYWSDYDGTDRYRGCDQNVLGSDGIGDTPYVIGVNNVDHYPLIKPYGSPQPSHPTQPVGGVYFETNKLELLAPWIILSSMLIVAAISIVYVRHRKKQQD